MKIRFKITEFTKTIFINFICMKLMTKVTLTLKTKIYCNNIMRYYKLLSGLVFSLLNLNFLRNDMRDIYFILFYSFYHNITSKSHIPIHLILDYVK